MTATRDDRGRFISADEFAANRLLNKAVAQAISEFYSVVFQERSASLTIGYKSPTVHAAVTTMLAEAGRSAELLLGAS